MKKLTGGTVVFLVLMVLCVIVAVNIVSRLNLIGDKRGELELFRAQIAEQNDRNNALREIVDSEDIDKYAEAIAREKLDYGMNNEKVYVNITGK